MGTGKIFIRERRKVGERDKKPRFVIVAISDIDLKVKVMHVRKQEIEEIASQLGAEIIYLKPVKDDEDDDDHGHEGCGREGHRREGHRRDGHN